MANEKKFRLDEGVRRSLATTVRLVMLVLSYVLISSAQQTGQPTFPSPVDASRALYQAAQKDDEKAMLEILGPAGKDLVSSGDPAEDLDSRMRFVVKYEQMHRLVQEPDGTVALYVGPENWPLPIPLVNKNGAWYYDADAGKQEVLARRIGKNELGGHPSLPGSGRGRKRILCPRKNKGFFAALHGELCERSRQAQWVVLARKQWRV